MNPDLDTFSTADLDTGLETGPETGPDTGPDTFRDTFFEAGSPASVAESATAEPQPQTLRWQPLRLGIVDLFYYENEIFPFRDGRLLLRGNNGAGKSKVLALTLPFLLDGDTSARRVEPDADPGKRMEWNLLLGGDYPHSERIGYAWLEFGRRDEDGTVHFLTLGAGLKAARGRGLTKSWFFITRQRIGHDLALVDQGRRALGRNRLTAELGESGRIYDTKRDYRRAIDEKLFGLGERRYDALIDLLLQIRAPQLSKRPSERLLSDALTESLTPVGREIIESVADALRGLDEERDQLQELTEAHRSVLAFLEHYRAYARVLAKRQSAKPRAAQSEHDQLGRDIAELTRQSADAAASLDRSSAELETLRRRQTEREAEREALRDSEFIEIEKQLASADDAVNTATDRLHRAESGRDDAQRAALQAESAVKGERARTADARERHALALAAAVDAADRAQLEHHHDHVVDGAAVEHALADDAAGGPITDGPAAGGPAADGAERAGALAIDVAATTERLDRAREAVARVRQLIDALNAAESQLGAERRRDDAAEARLAETLAARSAADEAFERAATQYTRDVEDAIARMSELSVADEDFTDFAEWVRHRDVENPAVRAIAMTATVVRSDLHALRASARQRADGLVAQRGILDREIASLERGETSPPPNWHTRTPDAADALPLWRAVSFHDSVGEGDRAGIEAALEASGLLGGVLLHSGGLRLPASGEVILRAAAAGSGSTLREVLRVGLPADSALDPAAVDAVLGAITLATDDDEPAPVWVSASGRFRLGAAHGAWRKPAAEYIGESARADARRRRLTAAGIERTELTVQAEAAVVECELCDSRLATVAAEERSLPLSTELDTTERVAAVAASLASNADRERADARASVEAKTLARDARAADLSQDAAALALPEDAAELAARTTALDEYDRRAREFWHAAERLVDAARVCVEAEHRLQERRGAALICEAEFAEADTDTASRSAYAQSLHASVGEDVARYRQRVAQVESDLTQVKRGIAAALHAREQAVKLGAVLDEKLRGARDKQDVASAQRVTAVTLLHKTASLGLVRVALPELEQPDAAAEWTVTQGVQLARAIDQSLGDLDASDVRYDRVLSQVHTEFTTLQRSLGRHGHEAVSYPHDEGYHVLVVFMGKEASLLELAEGLSGELEQRERLLGAREREIIEKHLVTEIGAQLSELVGAADAQIVDINAELASRPTSTGMKLRVRWKPRPDGPAGLAEVRAKFATASDAWGENDRAALGDFLQARIQEVRESDESGNWYDHLGEALDYRRWHHFAVERYQAGAWKPAAGPASGGERVLAASIPLFAAASSHYRTAGNPLAPRLIMLDEAFAGVDDSARASCLGLLAAFDLDVVMTSEREWGCYAEVPGLSIAQLSRFDDTPAVLVQLWSWDGRRRTRVEPVEPSESLW